MRITINIADSLLEAAKKVAMRENTTPQALVEEGLKRVIADRKDKAKFTLRKASFKGNGLQPEFIGENWLKIRSTAYETYDE